MMPGLLHLDPRILILSGALDAASISVPGRSELCPSCGVSAWFGPRAFEDCDVSYYLCKWCGFRRLKDEADENGTLALPVYHVCDPLCDPPKGWLTWHQFGGPTHWEKCWKCACGAELRILDSLRPFPRFGRDIGLMELPGE
jgi:hypothetical protein